MEKKTVCQKKETVKWILPQTITKVKFFSLFYRKNDETNARPYHIDGQLQRFHFFSILIQQHFFSTTIFTTYEKKKKCEQQRFLFPKLSRNNKRTSFIWLFYNYMDSISPDVSMTTSVLKKKKRIRIEFDSFF